MENKNDTVMNQEQAIRIAGQYVQEAIGIASEVLTRSVVYFCDEGNTSIAMEGRPTWEVIYVINHSYIDFSDLVIRIDAATREAWDTLKGYPSPTSWRAFRVRFGLLRRRVPRRLQSERRPRRKRYPVTIFRAFPFAYNAIVRFGPVALLKRPKSILHC